MFIDFTMVKIILKRTIFHIVHNYNAIYSVLVLFNIMRFESNDAFIAQVYVTENLFTLNAMLSIRNLIENKAPIFESLSSEFYGFVYF